MNIEKTINNVDKKLKAGEDAAYDKVDAARRQGKEWAEDAAGAAEERMDLVRETLEESWDKAKKTGANIEKKIEEYGKQGLKSAQQYTQKNPLKVVGIALALGVVLGGALWAAASSKE